MHFSLIEVISSLRQIHISMFSGSQMHPFVKQGIFGILFVYLLLWSFNRWTFSSLATEDKLGCIHVDDNELKLFYHVCTHLIFQLKDQCLNTNMI